MPGAADSGPVRAERSGPVATLAIDRPEKLNAIDRAVRRALIAALDELAVDPEVRVVILCGAGDRAFSAGSDIAEFPGRSPLQAYRALRGDDAYSAVEAFPKPVIAMIDGYCLGGGCELACVCDLRIASDRARFGQPEIDLGAIPGVGGTQYLPRLMGQSRALRLILTGEMIDARRALEIGLVDEVVPHLELQGRTQALATAVAARAATSVDALKMSVRAAWRA